LSQCGAEGSLGCCGINHLDFGHSLSAQAQSTQVNGVRAVLRATLTVVQQLHGGSVEYLLSNNGGASWEAVELGVEHLFASTGSDLRWKAVLHGDGRDTPAIDELRIDWQEEDVTPTQTASPTHTVTPTATWTATASPTHTATRTASWTPTVCPTATPWRNYLPMIIK